MASCTWPVLTEHFRGITSPPVNQVSLWISGNVPNACLCSREQLAESILHEGSTGCRVVEKFLKILQVVVQEPGQVFKPFLPSVISLCMEQVYPIIAEVGKGRHCWGDGSSEALAFQELQVWRENTLWGSGQWDWKQGGWRILSGISREAKIRGVVKAGGTAWSQ